MQRPLVTSVTLASPFEVVMPDPLTLEAKDRERTGGKDSRKK